MGLVSVKIWELNKIFVGNAISWEDIVLLDLSPTEQFHSKLLGVHVIKNKRPEDQ